jgi:hypothetical protein
MRLIAPGFIVASLLLACPGLAVAADDSATCTARHAEITKQAAAFNGEARIKRLIDADLSRALREQAEGDSDECIEALDHATKLLAGDM